MSAVPQTRRAEPAPVPAASGRWALVPEASRAGFHVRDKLVATVHGTMPLQEGALVVSDTGDVVQGWVTVSVAGIETGNGHRDRDLRKARFLDAEQFPTVRISVDAAPLTASGCTADGTVLARGVAAPVQLVAEVVEASPSQVRVRVTGTLDRQPLGIKVPAFVVGRHVQLEADLTFRRAPDPAAD